MFSIPIALLCLDAVLRLSFIPGDPKEELEHREQDLSGGYDTATPSEEEVSPARPVTGLSATARTPQKKGVTYLVIGATEPQAYLHGPKPADQAPRTCRLPFIF